MLPNGTMIVGFRHFRPGLPFYLRRPVLLATTDGHELTSNYVSSQRERFLEGADLATLRRGRSIIRETSPVYVLTGASWIPGSQWFRDIPLTFVGRDHRSALWLR